MLLGKHGRHRVSTYPARARLKLGGGRLGEVRFAADIPVGVAGRKVEFTAFALEADIPELIRKRATEPLGGQPDFSRDASTLREQGLGIPLKVNRMGRYVSGVVAFAEGR